MGKCFGNYYKICVICKKRFRCRDGWDFKISQTCSRKCGGILAASKFHPEQYLSKWMKSHNNHPWNYKGKHIKPDGEIYISLGNNRYIKEHRLVIEKYLNRKLSSQEIVHHIDGNKSNNKLSNLYLYSSQKFHRLGHYSMEQIVYELYKQGKVKFDKEQGKYYLL